MNKNNLRIRDVEITLKIDGEVQYGELSPKCHRNILDERIEEMFPCLSETKKRWIDYVGFINDLWFNEKISDEKRDQINKMLYENAFEINEGKVTDEVQALLDFIDNAVEEYL